jgi:hypothetical protein
MVKGLLGSAILALLSEGDAQGQGYTAVTIATRLCGAPRNPLDAAEQRATAEAVIESLVARGRLQVAGHIYLEGGKIPRYTLASHPLEGGDNRLDPLWRAHEDPLNRGG